MELRPNMCVLMLRIQFQVKYLFDVCAKKMILESVLILFFKYYW